MSWPNETGGPNMNARKDFSFMGKPKELTYRGRKCLGPISSILRNNRLDTYTVLPRYLCQDSLDNSRSTKTMSIFPNWCLCLCCHLKRT